MSYLIDKNTAEPTLPPSSEQPDQPKNNYDNSPKNTREHLNEEVDRGDPEMVPIYLKLLLPLLVEVFHSSLSQTLRYVSSSFVCFFDFLIL